jgi:D-cysteine desulfhydrase family pyridoxal phosphate-dependent enzyme
MPAKVRIAHLPTPVEPLERLSRLLGGPTLLVKRDDQTGLAGGGNKTRKLEYLLAEAASQGARTLITGGAVQSNHCRQTAAAAARSGLACTLVLTGDQPGELSGNLLLDRLLGAEIVWAGSRDRDQLMQEVYSEAHSQGRHPYLVPYGGSSPVGASAYAYALQELQDQQVQADWIVAGSSSGGTQAGLVAGSRLFNYAGQVLGISIDLPAQELQVKVAQLAGQTAALLGRPVEFSPEEILVSDQYLGKGYAVMGEAEREAIHLFARLEGLLLDPVYTGRAAAGLLDLVRQGFFHPEDMVVFWHTGGTPALFADHYENQLSQA